MNERVTSWSRQARQIAPWSIAPLVLLVAVLYFAVDGAPPLRPPHAPPPKPRQFHAEPALASAEPQEWQALRTEAPAGRLAMRVLDESGRPIQGVRVADRALSSRAMLGPTLGETTTDGLATIPEDALRGIATVIVSHPAYRPTSVSVQTWRESIGIDVKLVKGAVLGLSITNPQGGPVEGVLCVASNRGVDDATIDVCKILDAVCYAGHADASSVSAARSDANGRVLLAGLMSGSYSIEIVSDDYLVVEQHLGDTLPTEGRIVVVKPYVMLVDAPDTCLGPFSATIPRSFTATGIAQHEAAKLNARLRALFPGALCAVGVPNPHSKAQFDDHIALEYLDRERGWCATKVRLREYVRGILPSPIPNEAPAGGAAMGRVVIEVRGPDGDVWPFAEDGAWSAVPTDQPVRVRQKRAVPLKAKEENLLPIGEYSIEASDGLLARASPRQLLLVREGLTVNASVALGFDVAPLRVTVLDDLGIPVQEGVVTIGNSGAQETYIMARAMSGYRYWAPTGEITVDIRGPANCKAMASARVSSRLENELQLRVSR